MNSHLILVGIVIAGASTIAVAQAVPTASRLADLQVGVDFSIAKPDYGTQNFHGYGFYGDFDVRRHYGLEFSFHQLTGPQPMLYERSYEIGPRFVFPLGSRFAPYAKVMYGRGVFNFAGTDSSGKTVQIANLAYNIGTVGGGLDLKIRPGLNVRVVDLEYQDWLGFPPNGLTPAVLSFGVAYHFHGKQYLKK